MANQVTETARVATDAGSDVAATTVSQGQAVAGTAVEEARHVADAAMEQTSRVASELSTQARTALDQAKTDVKQQADQQTERLAESIRGVAGQLQALLDGRPQEAGQLPDLARQASGQLQTIADRIGQQGIDGVLGEAQRFARRRPGVFLAGAAAVGFAAGRLLRGAKAAPQLGVDGSSAQPQPQQRPLAGATTDGTDVIVLTDAPGTIETPPTVLSRMRDGDA